MSTEIIAFKGSGKIFFFKRAPTSDVYNWEEVSITSANVKTLRRLADHIELKLGGTNGADRHR